MHIVDVLSDTFLFSSLLFCSRRLSGFIISTSGISFSSIRFKVIHIFITLRTIKRIVQYPLILYLVITFGTIAVCVLLRVCLFHKLIICGEVVNLSVTFLFCILEFVNVDVIIVILMLIIPIFDFFL